MKRVVKKKKSALQKQVEKLFPLLPSDSSIVNPGFYPTYSEPSEPKVGRTYTTYSVFEDPIPNPYDRR